MKLHSGIPIGICIALQVQCISASGNYFIDPITCTGSTEQFVQQEMAYAIEMATLSATELNPGTVTALRFFNYLFARAPITYLYGTFKGSLQANLIGIANLHYVAGSAYLAGAGDVVRLFD